jgi:hypothetical protein
MFHRYKAIVTLSAPKTVKGMTVFTTARVVFPGSANSRIAPSASSSAVPRSSECLHVFVPTLSLRPGVRGDGCPPASERKC